MKALNHIKSSYQFIRDSGVAWILLWMIAAGAPDVTTLNALGDPTLGASFVPQTGPHHCPADSEKGTSELPVSEEKEFSDGSDDDSKEHSADLSRDKFASATAISFSLRQVARSIENRPSVLLFVLHHSWKSFPA